MNVSELEQCNNIEHGCSDGFDFMAANNFETVENAYDNINNVDWWLWCLSTIEYDITDFVVYVVESLDNPTKDQTDSCNLCVQETDLGRKGRLVSHLVPNLESQEICDYFRSQVTIDEVKKLITKKINES